MRNISIELKANTDDVTGIDRSINTMRESINANAAFIEEMAATSQDMSAFTNNLNKIVDKFKV